MKKNYSAVLFDLDGTLLNTLQDLTLAVNYTLQQMGFSTRTQDEVRSFVGDGMIKLLTRALPEKNQEDATVSKAYEIFRPYYTLHSADNTAVYAGVKECVLRLKQAGIPLAVVTNKDEEASIRLCRRFFGEQTFITIQGGKPSRAKKPDPSCVLDALKILGVTAEKALYVGDSDVDYYTGKNANMDCVLVSWGFRSREKLQSLAPTALVDDPSQLLEFLMG